MRMHDGVAAKAAPDAISRAYGVSMGVQMKKFLVRSSVAAFASLVLALGGCGGGGGGGDAVTPPVDGGGTAPAPVSMAQALSLMTKAPAEIFGLTDLGTLEAGKRADVVIWDGDPLELASAPVAVMIDGRQVPLTSRQTKLRDRYMPNRSDDMPVQYRR